MEIENSLMALRQKRGVSVADLAKLVGVTRQTVYAMEAGGFVPNTAVALRLAHVLETSVEELFRFKEDPGAPELPVESASILPGSEHLEPGQPVQLCRVGKTLCASPPSPVAWYFPASDAVIKANPQAGRAAAVQVFESGETFENRLLVAGCDPGISVLARHMRKAGMELVVAHRNSLQSLELLKQSCVHVAGTHLRDEATGDSNVPAIRALFPQRAVAVISFAVWEEGIVVAKGNKKSVRGIEDFARGDVRIVNREPGAGSRKLLDAQLEKLGIAATRMKGYEHLAPGHLAAAWLVKSGEADCCISTRAAARRFGLAFIPLVAERYDLAIHRKNLELPAAQALLNTLNRASFRRELESLGGYDTSSAGKQLL